MSLLQIASPIPQLASDHVGANILVTVDRLREVISTVLSDMKPQ